MAPQPAVPGRSAVSEVVKRAGPAVVSLRIFDAQGAPTGMGSGFLVEGGRVVTNAHVVEGAARVEVFDFEGNLLGAADHAESLSTRTDLAVLPAMPDPPAILQVSIEEPSVGEPVIAIGSPQGLTNTVSTGIVSAFRENEGLRLMQISAPISQGSSGGPVLNEQGQVVAVSVALLREGQNLNFAVPARNVRALLGSPPGKIALGGGIRPPAASGEEGTQASGTAPRKKGDARSTFRSFPGLVVGKGAVGQLEESDFELESGKRIDGFVFEGRAGEVFTLLAVSSEFDITLVAFEVDEKGEPDTLGFDDDGGGGTDARLVIRLRRNGPVGVFVSSAQAGEGGRYLIRVVKEGPQVAAGPEAGPPKDRWTRVATGEGFAVSIDRATLQRNPNGRVRAWQSVAFDAWQQTEDGVRYDNTTALEEYDCRGRRSLLLVFVQYAGGQVAHNSGNLAADSQWNHWIPGSVGEKTGEAACSR